MNRIIHSIMFFFTAAFLVSAAYGAETKETYKATIDMNATDFDYLRFT